MSSKMHPDMISKDMDWCEFYPPVAQARVDEASQKHLGDADIIIDADRFGVSGKVVPTLVKHGTLYCPAEHRHMTLGEHLCSIGLPAIPAAKQDFELPWGRALGSVIALQEVKGLGGNCMHMPCCCQP